MQMLQYRDGQLTGEKQHAIHAGDWKAASDTFILWMIGSLHSALRPNGDGTHGGYVYEAWLYDSSDQVPRTDGARRGMVKHHEAIARVFSDGRVVSVGSMVTPNPVLYQRGATFLTALSEIP
jgi:hypothetical protein